MKSGELREAVIYDTEEKITELGLNESAAKIVPKGSILVALYGATVGRMAFLGIDAATNQAVCNIRPDPKRADPRYVFHALQTKIGYFLSRAAGGAQPNISQAIIRETQIPLPPLDEQRRIAAILDKADALRRKRKRALDLLDGLPQSYFAALFGEHRESRTPVKPLSSVVDEIYRYPTYFGIEYTGSGVPEIRGELIRGDGAILDEPEILRYISTETSKRFPRTVVETGDLVMSVRGTIGKVGIVPHSLHGANITANLIRIAPARRLIEPTFLWFALLAPNARRALTNMSSLTTIATIKASDLRNIPILCPPLKDQRSFASIVTRLTAVRCVSAAALAGAEGLFLSLQQRAFSGQL